MTDTTTESRYSAPSVAELALRLKPILADLRAAHNPISPTTGRPARLYVPTSVLLLGAGLPSDRESFNCLRRALSQSRWRMIYLEDGRARWTPGRAVDLADLPRLDYCFLREKFRHGHAPLLWRPTPYERVDNYQHRMRTLHETSLQAQWRFEIVDGVRFLAACAREHGQNRLEMDRVARSLGWDRSDRGLRHYAGKALAKLGWCPVRAHGRASTWELPIPDVD